MATGLLLFALIAVWAAVVFKRGTREQPELAKQHLQDGLTAQAKEREQPELAKQHLYDVRHEYRPAVLGGR